MNCDRCCELINDLPQPSGYVFCSRECKLRLPTAEEIEAECRIIRVENGATKDTGNVSASSGESYKPHRLSLPHGRH